jgi:hypothetical protein
MVHPPGDDVRLVVSVCVRISGRSKGVLRAAVFACNSPPMAWPRRLMMERVALEDDGELIHMDRPYILWKMYAMPLICVSVAHGMQTSFPHTRRQLFAGCIGDRHAAQRDQP